MGRPRKDPVRISKLDRVVVQWVLARARTFIRLGKREWPAWGYGRISRNLRNAKKISVSRFAIRRLVMKLDPELARRRGRT